MKTLFFPFVSSFYQIENDWGNDKWAKKEIIEFKGIFETKMCLFILCTGGGAYTFEFDDSTVECEPNKNF